MIARRPIRFLVAVVGGWVGVRAALLWPVPEILPAIVGAFSAEAQAETRLPTFVSAEDRLPVSRPPKRAVIDGGQRPGGKLLVGAVPLVAPAPVADDTMIAEAAAAPTIDSPAPVPAGSISAPTFEQGRFSGSAWAILRPDGKSRPFASQLGGSQAGVRLAYAVDQARRLALVARASAALEVRQTEMGIGVDWRPTALPIHLVAERRIGVEGLRGGYAVGAIGGIGPVPVASLAQLEAYGQGGAIVRDGRTSGFVDGQVRLTRRIRLGRSELGAGIGTWGAAQEGAARLDAGPSIDARLPVGDRFVRVSLDWRQRIAGQTSPMSGPALSLGTDF